MTKKVIINADDFGMSEAYNYGVIKALRDGVASSTTIMINQPAAEHAVSLLKEVPGTSFYPGVPCCEEGGDRSGRPEDGFCRLRYYEWKGRKAV